MTFTFRPARDTDAEWLFTLRRATMRDYVEQMFGPWDDDTQRRRFQQAGELNNIRIIVVGRREVGLLHVERERFAVFLANIHILPEYQNRGLGTTVIRSVQAGGQAAELPVRLQVLKVNRKARRLYERLGFVLRGETDTHFRMIWQPA